MTDQFTNELKELRKQLYAYRYKSVELERQLKSHIQSHITFKDPSATSESIDAFEGSVNSPLTNEYLLEMIASYLPAQDVRNCRQVCKLWWHEMSRSLSNRKLLILSDEQSPEAEELLESKKSGNFVGISTLCLIEVAPTSNIVQKIMSAFGRTMNGLKLDDCDIDPEEFNEILQSKAPNLETLCVKQHAGHEDTLHFSYIFSSINNINPGLVLPHLKKLQWEELNSSIRLEDIIRTCPNLNDLEIKHWSLPDPSLFKDLRWPSLHTLSISSGHELKAEHYESLAALHLSLKKLILFQLKPGGRNKMEQLKKFLLSISSTLQDLSLYQHLLLDTAHFCLTYASAFPVTLPQLQSLTVDFGLVSSMKMLDNMEKLEKFQCKFEFWRDWWLLLNKKGLPSPHEALKELSLGSIDNGCLKKLSECFPQLSKLELCENKIGDQAMRTIISGFPSLTHLKVTKTKSNQPLPLTDSGLIGIDHGDLQLLEGKDYTFDASNLRKHPFIGDLKGLCGLEIITSDSKLTDLSVQFGIVHLKNLLILALPKCDLCNESFDAIQYQLTNLAMVELQNCPKVTQERIAQFRANRNNTVVNFSDVYTRKLCDLVVAVGRDLLPR